MVDFRWSGVARSIGVSRYTSFKCRWTKTAEVDLQEEAILYYRRATRPSLIILQKYVWPERRQFTKAQMRKFFHTMKALISCHVSATLIVIENRNHCLQNRKLHFTRYPASPLYSISFIFAVLLSIRVHSIAVRLGRAIMHQHTKIRLKSGASVFEISICHHVEFLKGQNCIWKWDLENWGISSYQI